jgi:hypothetical protein
MSPWGWMGLAIIATASAALVAIAAYWAVRLINRSTRGGSANNADAAATVSTEHLIVLTQLWIGTMLVALGGGPRRYLRRHLQQ